MSTGNTVNYNGPLVSIALPSYNHEKYIEECINSVIDQDYPNIELIIIDDGSTDGTASILEHLAEKCRGRFTRFELRVRQNKGQCATLNEALEWAGGEFFAQMDSDDVLMPNKISFQVEQFRNEPEIVGMFSGTLAIDERGAEIFRLTHPQRYYDFEDFIMHRHTFHTIGQLLRIDSVRKAGGYPDGCLIGDWYMWMAITRNGSKIKSSPEIFAKYRFHGDNSSKNKVKMFEARKYVLGFFRDSPLYTLAMSQACLWAARDFCFVSKKKAATCLMQSIGYTPKVVLHKYFSATLLGLLTPAFLAKRIPFFLKRFPNLD